MGLSTIIPSIIFGLVGLFIIIYVLRLMLTALLGNPLHWLEKQKIISKEKNLHSGDVFYQNNGFDNAISCWKNAFYLDRVKYLHSLVDRAHNLNMNVLGKLLMFSEKKSAHLINLASVEKLLGERTELLHTYFETNITLKKLRNRKKEPSTKNSPDWALQEFSKKFSEIKKALDSNRMQLQNELKILFDSLTQLSGRQGITYH